jgi:hypothetical protein
MAGIDTYGLQVNEVCVVFPLYFQVVSRVYVVHN